MRNIIDFENGKKQFERKLNKKKLVILITILTIIFIIFCMFIAYCSSKQFRKLLDTHLFRKNISEEKLASIQLDYDSNINILPHNKNISILAENVLRQYNSAGNLESEIKLEISNPVYCSNNKYLVISETNGSKLYLISDSKILWQKEVDGNISKLTVNKNGYVSAIISGTTYKSVIITFDIKGNELFKTYLSNTIAMDSTISQDNKSLAFAEINTFGTVIQSKIKIVSIEKAKDSPTDSIVYTYEAPSNSLITNIEYQNKDKLICMYDACIQMISQNKGEILMNLNEDDKKINMASINLENNIYRAIEKSTGLFTADTVVEILNTDNKKQTVYTLEGVAKNIYCNNNIIAINLGQEIHFISTNGWLIKDYSSTQDIQDIVIGNNIAGIIYNDRVDLINL